KQQIGCDPFPQKLRKKYKRQIYNTIAD
ncbi:MAG: hypothetical protein ACI9T7_002822, partial [Oleiphilaceae bacterium]